MASTPHTQKQRDDYQTERTAKLSAAPGHIASGQNTVAAWENSRAIELAFVVARETPSTPLT